MLLLIYSFFCYICTWFHYLHSLDNDVLETSKRRAMFYNILSQNFIVHCYCIPYIAGLVQWCYGQPSKQWNLKFGTWQMFQLKIEAHCSNIGRVLCIAISLKLTKQLTCQCRAAPQRAWKLFALLSFIPQLNHHRPGIWAKRAWKRFFLT